MRTGEFLRANSAECTAGRREREVVALTGMGDHLIDEMGLGSSYIKTYSYDEQGLLAREELFMRRYQGTRITA